jgi:hypothetical protein
MTYGTMNGMPKFAELTSAHPKRRVFSVVIMMRRPPFHDRYRGSRDATNGQGAAYNPTSADI